MQATIHTAANGHLTINFNELPDTAWASLEFKLTQEHGFERVGSAVIGAGEQIHQSFKCPEFTLFAGWDNWSGHYLLSDSESGDQFLRGLFDRGIA